MGPKQANVKGVLCPGQASAPHCPALRLMHWAGGLGVRNYWAERRLGVAGRASFLDTLMYKDKAPGGC
eukprot:scaffold27061_cov129-Isochrysis_galbana.AAC.1